MVNVKPEQFQKIWSALITPTNDIRLWNCNGYRF